MSANYKFIIDDKDLGLVAKHHRIIKPGNEYNQYFERPTNQNIYIGDKTTFEAVNEINKIVSETLHQTKAIADVLFDQNLNTFCRNVWNFMYGHIQYKMDDKGKEQLREPNRSWADRRTGIDCDCFSLFISSILTNKGVPHFLRIVELKHKGYYQHIYVVVPKGKNHNINPWTGTSNYITIDPVLDRFDLEPENITYYKDFMASPTYRLAGLEDELGCNCTNEINGFDEFLGKAKTNLKVVINKAGVKKIVAAPKAAVKQVAKIPAKAIPAAKTMPKAVVTQAAKAAPKPPITSAVKKVITQPNGKKQVVVAVPKVAAKNIPVPKKPLAVNQVAKPKAVVTQAAKAAPKPPITSAVKKVITQPNGKIQVVVAVPKVAAKNIPVPKKPVAVNTGAKTEQSEKEYYRDRIIDQLGLKPTQTQRLDFVTRTTLSDTVKVYKQIPIVKQSGLTALRPEERETYNKVVRWLTPPKVGVNNIASNNVAPKPNSFTPQTNSQQQASDETENVSNEFATNNTTLPDVTQNNQSESEAAPLAKKNNTGLIVGTALALAAIGAAVALGGKKSKPLSGDDDTNTVDVEHEVIETNLGYAGNKPRKLNPKSVKKLAI